MTCSWLLLRRKRCCGDDRCFALLKHLSAKTRIALERTDEPEVLDEVIEDLLEHMSKLQDEGIRPDKIVEVFNCLMQMPQEMANMLYSLAEAGALPE